MRKRKVFLTCIILLLTSLGVLFFTNTGLLLSLKLARSFLPGFNVASAKGRLVGSFTLQEMQYTDDGMSVEIDNVSVSWNPAALLQTDLVIKTLDVKGVAIHVKEREGSEDAAPESPLTFPVPALPVVVKINKAALTSLRVFRPEDSGPVLVDKLDLDSVVLADSLLRFEQINITAPAYTVHAGGEVRGGTSSFLKISTAYSFEPDGYGQIEGEADLSGSPAELSISSLLSKPFSGTLEGKVDDIFTNPVWQLLVKSENIKITEINAGWPYFSFKNAFINGQGTTDRYSVQLETDYENAAIGDIRIQAHLNGDGRGLQITDTHLNRLSGHVTLEGNLNWEDHFKWDARVVGEHVVPTDLNQQWPGLLIKKIVLEGKGEQDRYSLGLNAEGSHGAVQDIFLESGITGDAAGVELSDLLLTHDSGELAGGIRFGWENGFEWDGILTGKNIDPGLIEQRVRGRLDMQLQSAGTYLNDTVNGYLQLLSLDGQIRDFPVQGKGRVSVAENDFNIEELVFTSAETEIKASGFAGEVLGIDVGLNSPDLFKLWPELSGELQADISISGKKAHPKILVNLQGRELKVYSNTIQEIDGRIAGLLEENGMVDARVTATGLEVSGNRIDGVDFELAGTVNDHSVQLKALRDDEGLTVAAKGWWKDDVWNLNFKSVELQTNNYGAWYLHEPAKLSFFDQGYKLDDFCLTRQAGDKVCASGMFANSSQWDVKTQFDTVPLSLLSRKSIDRELVFAGSFSGDMTLASLENHILNGRLALETDGASAKLILPDAEHYKLNWQDNSLSAELDQGLLSAEITSILQDGSRLSGSATVDHFYPASLDLEKMEVHGNVDFQINDINPFTVFTFPFVEPDGRMAASLGISGTVASPLFKGKAGLQDGEFFVPSLGISIEELALQSTSQNEKTSFTVTGKSGNGTIKADGELIAGTGKENSLNFTLTGKHFEAAHLPELAVSISPNLAVRMGRQSGEVKGNIYITEAIISPHSLSGSIAPSKDIVFVDSVGDDVGGKEKWAYSADVSIDLSDKVFVDAFGLKSRVAGSVQVAAVPGRAVAGNGSLNIVEGTFAVYGRELDIKTGRLLFSNGPIDNPGIIVRAENTTRNITTGIDVSGFLREPEINFYSVPHMEQSEIISRLLMNTSLENSSDFQKVVPVRSTISEIKDTLRLDDVRVEAGETDEDLSLVIGTWISPKLYISYGKNLLKESGAFHTKYLLGKGFLFETESGSTQSGFDLMYEVEK